MCRAFCGTKLLISLGEYQKVWLLDHMVRICVDLYWTSTLFLYFFFNEFLLQSLGNCGELSKTEATFKLLIHQQTNEVWCQGTLDNPAWGGLGNMWHLSCDDASFSVCINSLWKQCV